MSTYYTFDEMMIAAEVYHEKGMAIIPFYINPQADANGVHDKKPMIPTYKKWQTDPQTDVEFRALDWNGCNGFGLLLGKRTVDNRYLAVLDYDTKNNKTTPEEREAYNQAAKKGKEIFDAFPITMLEKTVNSGLHKLYWVKEKPKTNGVFHDVAALELLGENKLCVMRPSFGYQNVGSDVIAEVENLDEMFRCLLKKHGFAVNEETEIQHQIDNYSFEIGKLIDLSTMENKGDGQYQGKHPVHDSTTEKNFCVDTKHNQWFCFRHNSGGGALQYLAMKEGVIKCEDAKKGALKGAKFEKVLQLAVANGLLDEKILTQSEINPVILAKDIMEEHIFAVDAETDELYYYVNFGKDEGIYSNKTEQLIRREIVARLDENFKARYQNEITEFILGKAPLVEMGISNPDLLAVQNGLLNTRLKTLEKHSDKNYIVNKLPVLYDKDCKSTVWIDYIAKVLPNSIQRRQMQQLIGQCLYGKIITDTCLILIGKGSNSKSIALLIITKFLGGSKNVSSHSIQQLCYDKFITGEVRGKLANICADLPHKELLNTAIFKALTSGDSVQAYIKHVQKSVSFLPTAKYIFSANQIPSVANEEDCYAWYRRFALADFSVTFTKENSTPRQELLNSLSTPDCFSEILNWGLDGLTTLNKGGDITDRPTVEQIRLEYIRHTDSALAYFADCVVCTNEASDYVFTDVWFRDYITYCHNHGKQGKTQGDFINTAKQHLLGAEKTRIRPEYELSEPKPNAISAFRYIKLKSVSPVSDVSTFQTIRAKTEKNTLVNYSVSEVIVSKADTTDTPDTKQVEGVAEESGLRRKAVSDLVTAKRFKPKGVQCQRQEQGEPCLKKAEYSISGNLFCPAHFDVEKENLRKIEKTVCVEYTEEAFS